MKKVDIYICSKPLQYFNICNIPKTGGNKQVLVICDVFYRALDFADNVRKYDKHWDEVLFETNRGWIKSVLKYKVDRLYFGIDSTIVGALHFVKRSKFFLYEEGAGCYRQLRIQNKYKWLAKLFGTGEVMGRSKYLQGVFVYYPSYYLSQIKPQCPALNFTYSYRENIQKNAKHYLQLCNIDIKEVPYLSIKDSKILLYITDWDYQISTIMRMEEEQKKYDYLFLKPHPHIKAENMPKKKGIEVLYTNIVVEVIIQIWLEQNNQVTVYHQDSTAITPFGKEIDSINVSESPDPVYHEIIETLKLLSCGSGK